MTQGNGLVALKNRHRNIQKQRRIKIDLTKTQYQLIRNVALNQVGWSLWGREDQKGDANIFWVDTYITQQNVKRLRPYQRVNHFPNSQQLGKKNLLSDNLKRMKNLYPRQYNFFPQTWTMPQEYELFQSNQKQQQPESNKWYIVKPSASSQGKGIYLTKRIETDYRQPTIVQKYISNPFLIQGCKFDLRIYVLLKSLHPLKIFRYEEGLMRLSTSVYEQPNKLNKTDLNMHLTNYAINKFSPSFIQNKNIQQDFIGHKRSLSAVYSYLSRMGCDSNLLQHKIDQIIVKTIISAYPKLIQSYRDCRQIEEQSDSVCFQIYGFDILIDESFRPWLIQVNHSPSFCTQSPLDYVIKRCLILDTLIILNLNGDDKQSFLKFKYKQKDGSQKDKDVVRIKRKSQQLFQQSHLGGFVKIYPNPNQQIYSVLLKRTIRKKNRYLSIKKAQNKIQQQFISLPLSTVAPDLSTRKKNALTIYGRFKDKEGGEDQYNYTQEYNLQLKALLLQKEKKKTIEPVKLNNINLNFYEDGKPKFNNVFLSRKTTIYHQKPNLRRHIPLNSLVLQSRIADWDRDDIRKFDYQLKMRIQRMKLVRIKLQKTSKQRQSQSYSHRMMIDPFRSQIRGQIKYAQPIFHSKLKD